MKIVKTIPTSYTIVYVEDGGKYAAYKRYESDEWYDATNNRKIGSSDLVKRLESAYSESEK